MSDTNSKDLPPVASQSDQDIIEDAKRFLELYNTVESEGDLQAKTDLQFLVGNHWPEAQRRQREIDGRPCLTVNKLPSFLNQVTNDQRQHRATIKVSPVGSGTDVDTAEVYQGIIKHIEYDSGAEIATDTAVHSASAIGKGYFRIMPEYEDEKSFNQVLRFHRIRNTFTVAFDPGSTESDGSDAQRVAIHILMDRDAFKLEYPDCDIPTDGFSSSSSKGLVQWLTDKWIRVMEFYRIEREAATLVKMSDGGIFWEDEVPTDEQLAEINVTRIASRKSYKKKVMWYKLTTTEILERTEILCDWIPVFPVYGSEIDMDGKVVRAGVLRHARDPQLMYDFWMTAATEEIALRPKTPYIGAKGQFTNEEEKWGTANNRSFSYLEYNQVTLDGVQAPPPQRQPMADIPNGMLTMAMHANDNIKATTGLFDSSLGAQGNATSGKQELAQQRQGSIGQFHFQDGLFRTLRHVGRCLISMVPRYYDNTRLVMIMRDDGEIKGVEINKQLSEEEQAADLEQRKAKAQGKYDVAIRKILNDITRGKYSVVVDDGPSYSTMREQAADAMIQFGQSWPKLMDVAGDKVVKAMNWPGAHEIAERIERTIPAEIKYDPDDPEAGPPPVPPQVKQQLEQMKEMIAKLQEENHKLTSGVDREQIKAQALVEATQITAESRAEAAQLAAESRKDVEEIKGAVAMLLAKLNPPKELTEDIRRDIV